MSATRDPRPESPGPLRRRSRYAGAAIFLLALLVRLAHLLQVAPTPLMGYHRTFRDSDMYMFDQWARRIVEGDVLGREVYHPVNQWQLGTAPIEKWRAWFGTSPVFYKAPFYPYLIALLRGLFGEPMIPLALLQILASSASALVLLRITQRLFDRAVGLAAAALFALYAPAIHYDMVMLRGPWIVLASLAVTWQLLELRSRPSARRALLLGLTLGTALLVNEGFLTLLPLVALVLWRWFREARLLARLGGALALGLALALSPVAARNVWVGAPPLKLAVTGATVYAVFNAADSDPYFFRINYGSLARLIEQGRGRLLATAWACLRSFETPGDVVLFYLRKAAGLVIPYENPDNASFYYAAAKDPPLGLLPNYALLLPLAVLGLVVATRRRVSLAGLLPAALSLLLAIVITIPLSRYRATLAVYLLPFAGLAVVQAGRWARARSVKPLGGALAGLVVLAAGAHALERHVVFGGRPKEAYWYRTAEFGVGAEAYAKEGRFKDAAREYLELARLNPEPPTRSWALLMAAQSQVRAGESGLGRDALEAAVRANGGDARLLMAVGDAYLNLLGDRTSSVLHYRRAMDLRPPDALLAALRERLARVEGPPPME